MLKLLPHLHIAASTVAQAPTTLLLGLQTASRALSAAWLGAVREQLSRSISHMALQPPAEKRISAHSGVALQHRQTHFHTDREEKPGERAPAQCSERQSNGRFDCI
jgi:hypothetical protein